MTILSIAGQGFDGATQNFTRADSRLKNDSLDTPTGAAAIEADAAAGACAA